MTPNLDEIRRAFSQNLIIDSNEVALPIWSSINQYGIGFDHSGAVVLVLRSCDRSTDIYERNFSFRSSTTLTIKGHGSVGNVSVLTVNRLSSNSFDVDAIATIFLGLIEVAAESSVALSEVIESLSELFEKGSFESVSIEDQIGLAGELLLINNAADIEIAVRAWRSGDRDLFDFSNHSERVEVKTTVSTERIHSFNENQVPGPTGCSVIVASVLLRRTERGITVSMLGTEIWNKLTNSLIKAEFLKKVGVVLSGNVNSKELLQFDLEGSTRSIKFYPAESVPRPIQVPGVLSMSWSALLDGDFLIERRTELINSLCSG